MNFLPAFWSNQGFQTTVMLDLGYMTMVAKIAHYLAAAYAILMAKGVRSYTL